MSESDGNSKLVGEKEKQQTFIREIEKAYYKERKRQVFREEEKKGKLFGEKEKQQTIEEKRVKANY